MKRLRLLLLILCSGLLLQAINPSGATKSVTTAGTAVRLAASTTPAIWVAVQAKTTNTGVICVGGSDVLAATKNGTCLTAGQAVLFAQIPGIQYDLNTIWIDSTVNGEGVGVTYVW
jgi:hypothetical protein